MAIIRKVRTEEGGLTLSGGSIGARGGIFGGLGGSDAGGPRRGARKPTFSSPQVGPILAPIDNEVDLASILDTIVTPFILPNLSQGIFNTQSFLIDTTIGVSPVAADAAAQASICLCD